MQNGEYSFELVHLPQGLKQGCKVCRMVLISGHYLIRLFVRDNDQTFSYFLGVPPFEHCGELKHMFQCFKTQEAALAEMERVKRHLDETGSTEGLWLCPLTPEVLFPMLKAMERH